MSNDKIEELQHALDEWLAICGGMVMGRASQGQMVKVKNMSANLGKTPHLVLAELLDAQLKKPLIDTVEELKGKVASGGWVLIDTDNFAGDYPNEAYIKADSIDDRGRYETTKVLGLAHRWGDDPSAIAKRINDIAGEASVRYVKAERDTYKLQPGFEP